jgi:sugar/nucleoside kinase (ribokinase family)
VPACDLLVLGELNPDVVVACAGEVAFGQVEQLVDRAGLALGSSGAITAAAAAAQGLRVSFCAVVGDDVLGRVTVDLLATHGVDVSGVLRRDGVPTGITTVLTRPDGDRALLTYLGAMAELRAEDVDPRLLSGARHVHVSSVFLQRALQPGLRGLLREARAGGATTSLDPGWDPDEQWGAARDVLGELDYLLPNAAECVGIAGVGSAVTAAARALSERGPVVAVKLGAQGAALAGPDGLRSVRTEPVVPVDTTGAGDNFDAGFLAARLDGASFDDALRRAVACGSVSVGGWGGTGRLATREEAVDAAARLIAAPENSMIGT